MELSRRRKLVPVFLGYLTFAAALTGIVLYMLAVNDFYTNFGTEGEAVNLQNGPTWLTGSVGNITKWYRWDYLKNKFSLPDQEDPTLKICSNTTQGIDIYLSRGMHIPKNPTPITRFSETTWIKYGTFNCSLLDNGQTCDYSSFYFGVKSKTGDSAPYVLRVQYELFEDCVRIDWSKGALIWGGVVATIGLITAVLTFYCLGKKHNDEEDPLIEETDNQGFPPLNSVN